MNTDAVAEHWNCIRPCRRVQQSGCSVCHLCPPHIPMDIFPTLTSTCIGSNSNIKRKIKIPEKYSHPGVFAVLVDLRPGVLDQHLLPLVQRTRSLQVIQLSLSLHPLHLGKHSCAELSTCRRQGSDKSNPPASKINTVFLPLFLLFVSFLLVREREFPSPPYFPSEGCLNLCWARVWLKNRLKKHKKTHAEDEEELLYSLLYTLPSLPFPPSFSPPPPLPPPPSLPPLFFPFFPPPFLGFFFKN